MGIKYSFLPKRQCLNNYSCPALLARSSLLMLREVTKSVTSLIASKNWPATRLTVWSVEPLSSMKSLPSMSVVLRPRLTLRLLAPLMVESVREKRRFTLDQRRSSTNIKRPKAALEYYAVEDSGK